MRSGRSMFALLGLLTVGAVAGSMPTHDDGARLLQPYGELEPGRYLDAAHLGSDTAPRAGSVRAKRWQAAQRHGLDALIVQPNAMRGAYRDHGAVYSAWGPSQRRDERAMR